MHSLFLFFDYFSFFIFFTIYFFKLFILLYFLFLLLSYNFSFNICSRCFKRIKHVLFISNSFLKMSIVCLLFLLLFCFQYFKKWAKKIIKKIHPWYLCRRFFADFCVVELLCYTSVVWSNGRDELLVLDFVHVVWNNNTQQCYQHLDLNWYQDSC